jgi:hypothetical protein
MFHTGAGQHMDIDKPVLRFVRPVAKSLDIDSYGLHGFRRGIASNLYELDADEKIVQRPASRKVACHEGSLHEDVRPGAGRSDEETGGCGRVGEPECTKSAPN